MSSLRAVRVLMIAPTPYFSDRGCHVRIYEEANYLKSIGHEVHICTYHLGRNMDGIPTYRIPTIPWYKKLAAGPSWQKPILDILLFFTSLRIAIKIKPDIIHAHLHEGAFIGYFIKKLLKIPMILDCQGSLTEELLDHGFVKKGSTLYRLFYILEKRINQWADHLIASSTRSARFMIEHFGIDKREIDVISDGVDINNFCPSLDVGELHKELGLPESKKIVVFLGALTQYQGIDLLLEAIRSLIKHTKQLHFLLMGYPEQRYVRLAQEMGISPYVTFTGQIDYRRAPEYLCLGDLAVAPKLSKTESDAKLYNYMACGLPTVAFDTELSRQILGDLGVYATFGDADDLASNLKRLALDHLLREQISKNLRDKAVFDYPWSRNSSKIVRVYQDLLGGIYEQWESTG